MRYLCGEGDDLARLAWTPTYRTLVLPLVVVLLLSGCRWRMFESVEIKATPTLLLPGGTIRRAISELEQFADLERQLADAFDSGERTETDPYTYRGTATPLSVSVDEFFDDAEVNQTVDMTDVVFEQIDLDAIAIPAMSGSSILVTEGDGESPEVSQAVTVGPIAGFVSGTIGVGTLSVQVGAAGEELPDGTYDFTVTVEGAAGSFVDDVVTGAIDPGIRELDVGLAGLEIENGGEITVVVELSWQGAADTATVPVSGAFTIEEFSVLLLDVGTDPVSGLDIDPIAIDEEVRRQVKSVELDTGTSEIRLTLEADLPTGLELTLTSAELFAAEQTRTVEAGRPGEAQTLVYHVDQGDAIVFADPDDPTNGIDEFIVEVSKRLVGYDDDTGYLELTDVSADSELSVTNAAAQIDLEVARVTLRSMRKILEGVEAELGEEDLQALNELPEWLRLVTVPVRFTLKGMVAVPEVVLTLTAYDGDEEVERIVFDPVGPDSGAEADLAPVVNARPTGITFDLEPADEEGGNTSLELVPGDVVDLSVALSVVFAIQVVPDGADEVELLAEFLGDGGARPENDALGRADPDDLGEIFDSLGSASLTVDFRENTTGLDELRYEITHGSNGEWIIATGPVGTGETTIALSSDDLQRIRDTFPFTPSFALYLAGRSGEESYRLNYHGVLAANVVMELVTDVAHTFELFGEGDSEDG